MFTLRFSYPSLKEYEIGPVEQVRVKYHGSVLPIRNDRCLRLLTSQERLNDV